MKKTLVALAVLAASGASFAQVTISGKLGFSLQKDAAVVSTQGMRTTDGDVGFKATEDLGGGYSATADTRIKLRGRDTTVTARDATISLVTPVALVQVGSIEAAPLLASAGWGIAPASFNNGPDALILDGYTNVDFAAAYLPLGAVTLGYSFSEIEATNDAGPTAGNTSTINANQLVAKYVAGPVSVTGDYTLFAARSSLSPTHELTDGLGRFRVAGTYDLGVVQLGLGVQTKTKGVSSQYTFSAAAPLGALTVGLTYTARNAQDAIVNGAGVTLLAATEARSGTTIGLKYNLSKTTDISAQYAVYQNVGTGVGAAFAKTHDNEYRVRLMKAF